MATKKRLHQTFDEVQEILDRALVQPDWNETDPESDAYIRNRPFGEEGESDPAMLLWDGEWGDVDQFYLNYGEEYIPIYRRLPFPSNDWVDESGRWEIEWRIGEDLLFRDNDGVYPSVTIEEFFPGRTPQPYDLGFEIGEVTTSKLDNKYLDLDSSPVEDSGKPITSCGVYEALEDVAIIGDEIGSTPAPGVDFNAYTDMVWNKEQTLSQTQKDQVKANLGITCDENLSNLEIIELLGL